MYILIVDGRSVYSTSHEIFIIIQPTTIRQPPRKNVILQPRFYATPQIYIMLTVFIRFTETVLRVKMTAIYVTVTMSMTVALLISGMQASCGGEGPAGLVDAGANAVVGHSQVMCEDVRLKCAFGPGCSMALHNYFAKCDRMLQADATTCPESCLYALVALISTEDGKRMLDVSTYLPTICTLKFLWFSYSNLSYVLLS